jgi:hypothetical protein
VANAKLPLLLPPSRVPMNKKVDRNLRQIDDINLSDRGGRRSRSKRIEASRNPSGKSKNNDPRGRGEAPRCKASLDAGPYLSTSLRFAAETGGL